jgi:hypothetical protein
MVDCALSMAFNSGASPSSGSTHSFICNRLCS